MKTKLLLSLMAVAIFCFSQKAKANESEPNNTWNQANTLALNGSNNGSIKPAADVDWWKVKTNSDGLLSITLTPLSGTYTYVELYDTLGTIKLAGNYGNSVFSISSDGLAQGTYYLKVYCYYATDTVSYLISNKLTKPAQANDAEPNNTKAQALVLPLNGSTTGHVNYYFNNHRDTTDWYTVTTNKDGLLRLSLTPADGQYVYLTLYDHDGTTVLNSQNGNAAFSISTDGLASGTYYLRVSCFYENIGFAPYTLADSLFIPAQANDAEPNDTKAQALVLPLNGSTTGHVNYYFNNHRDTTDWYKVTTNKDGRLRLSLTPADGQYVYVTLYDHDGTTVLNSQDGNVAFSVSTDGLAAGTYYLRVYCFYENSGFAPYTLADSLFSPAQANDAEPDDTKAQALTLALNGSTKGHVGYYYNNHRDTTDWYKVTTNADGLLRLSLSLVNGQYVYVTLYDNDGTTVLNSNDNNVPFTFSTDGLAAGTYYLRVYCYYENSGFAPYTLSDSLFTYSNANDVEPNNKPYLAKTLPANNSAPGHVGFYYNNQRDTMDWHKINYTGSGALTVTMNLEPGKLNGYQLIYMQIWKDTLASAIYNNNNNGTSSLVASLTGLAQGYYWVRIIPYYTNSGFGSYSLRPTFTQVNKATIKVLSYDTAGSCSSTNTIIYKCARSGFPYTVQLYRFRVAYGSPLTVGKTGKATFSNLPDGAYYATVLGDGATGNAFGRSDTISIMPPPTNTSTTGIQATQAKLNWQGIACADYYAIQYHVHGATTWNSVNTTGNVNSFVLKGLNASTSYDWRAASVDSANSISAISTYTDSITFTTKASAFAEEGSNEEDKLSSGIDKLKNSSLVISPNPATSFFTIHYNAAIQDKLVATLYDINGKAVWASGSIYAAALNNKQVMVNQFSNGLYYLKLTDAQGMVVGSIKIAIAK